MGEREGKLWQTVAVFILKNVKLASDLLTWQLLVKSLCGVSSHKVQLIAGTSGR